MADDFNDWIDGEPITGPSSDGSFTEWIDGEPVIRYAAETATDLVVAACDHLHDADSLDLLEGISVWSQALTNTTSYLRSYRILLPNASISDPGKPVQYARVKIAEDFGYGYKITGASIGLRSGATEDYVADSIVRLTFNDGDNFLDDVGGSQTYVWSDWVPFPQFDEAADTFIHIDTANSTTWGSSVRIPLESGGTTYRIDGQYSDAMVADITGYTSNSYMYAVLELQVAAAAATELVIPDATHLHDADVADLLMSTSEVFTATVSNNVGGNKSFRLILEAADVSDPSFTVTKVRVEIQRPGSTYGYKIVKAAIGVRDGSTSSFSSGTQVQLTFDSGSASKDNIAGTGTYWSDWVEFPDFDDTVDLLVSLNLDEGSSYPSGYYIPTSGFGGGKCYRSTSELTDATDDDVDSGGSYAQNDYYFYVVTAVEVNDEAIPVTLFTTDFSDQSLGSPPSDWTERWNTADGAFNTVGGYAGTGSKAIEFDLSSPDDYGVSWDTAGTSADVEVLALIKTGYWGAVHYGGLHVRGSGSSGAENGYGLWGYSHDRLYLYKLDAGTPTQLDYEAINNRFTTTNYTWWRFRVVGTLLKGKSWELGAAEPGTWGVEATNADITGAGWIGVDYRTPLQISQIEWIGVDTGGGTVALPDLSTNLVVAACAHLHDADNLTITTGSAATDLVVAACDNLHEADNIDLVELIDLTVAEAASLLVDEGPISIQTGLTLVVTESYHDLVDEGPLALTQEHALVVAECDHLQEADSIVLTALHILTVAECYHVHAPPNLTLTTLTALTVQESHHLHVSDNISLDYQPTLSGLDSYHVLADDFDYLRSPDTTLVLVENGVAGPQFSGRSAGTYRMPFNVTAAFPQHGKIRFQISAASDDSSTLVSASYGYRASGDTTTDTPTALTFSSVSLPYTISPGETFWSDWMDFNAATASEILVSLWFNATHYPAEWSDGRTRYWGQFATGDQTLTVNMTTWLTQSNTWYIRSIEVTEGALVINDGAHVTTSDNIDFNQHFLATAESYHDLISQFGLATPLAVADGAHLHTADNLAIGVPLEVNDADHLHDADNLDLTGTHNLTPAACDHLHDAEALTLTQDHTLALADDTLLHVADTLNLAGTNVLVVAEAYHVHAADNADLIVILGVDETYHEHTAPNLTLVSGFDLEIPETVILTESDNLDLVVGLTVVECFHDHLAENLALTQLHILKVQESYHLLVNEVPNPNMTGDLAMQNAWHAIVSDEIVLTGEHTLWMNDAYHRLVDDLTAVTQEHTLVIEDDGAYHLHTADNITLPVITAGLERTFIESLTVDRAFRTRTTDLEILTLTRPIDDTVLTSYLGVTTKHELASLTQVRTILRA